MRKVIILAISIYISLLSGNFLFQEFFIKSYEGISDNMMANMVYSKYTGFKTRPNIQIKHKDLLYKTHQHGFRNPGFKRDHSKKLIIILGDSHVWGWGKNDPDLISSRLSMSLPEYYQVYNIADIGFSSLQTFLMLDKLILDLKPSHIFWLNGHNDNYNNTRKFEYSLSKPILGNNNSCLVNYIPLRPIHFSRDQSLNKSFVTKKTKLQLNPFSFDLSIFLFNIVADIIEIKPSSLELNMFGRLPSCLESESITETGGDEQLVYLNSLVAKYSKKNNIQFTSVLTLNKKLSQVGRDYNNLLRTSLTKSGIKHIDLTKTIDKPFSQLFMTPYDHDDDHYSRELHNEIAKIMATEILSNTAVKQP